jgi:TPP-dependent pyruvate/acetoin dehydrogenase alpha subunit
MQINEDLKAKKFKIPVHLGLGTESLVVAVSTMMRSEDNLLLTHRNAAFNLMRSSDPESIVREYEGQESGLAFGRLGSMNLAHPETGVVYSSSILANNISVACGFAYSQKILQNDSISIVLTGDGAMEEGAFYEGLVFAKSHSLPLILIVDNNDYSMASSISERRCEIDLKTFCESIGLNFLKLTSNCAQSYANELEEVRSKVKNTMTPFVIEAQTNLLNQHAGPTPGWPTDPMQVDLKNGLVITEDSGDPVFLLREKYGFGVFSEFESQIISADAKMVEK